MTQVKKNARAHTQAHQFEIAHKNINYIVTLFISLTKNWKFSSVNGIVRNMCVRHHKWSNHLTILSIYISNIYFAIENNGHISTAHFIRSSASQTASRLNKLTTMKKQNDISSLVSFELNENEMEMNGKFLPFYSTLMNTNYHFITLSLFSTSIKKFVVRCLCAQTDWFTIFGIFGGVSFYDS